MAKWMPARSRPGHRQIARRGRAARRARSRRTRGAASSTGTSTPMLHAGAEHDALLLHQREPAIEDALLHLELGNAVAQQAADAIGALEDRHQVAGAVELIGGGEPGRARADDGDPLAGPRRAGGRGTIQPSSNARSMIDELDRS